GKHGRVIDMAGDSVLAVFETALGAVEAALAIQEAINASAAAQDAGRRMLFRIGVHLGDLIEKSDGSVYGDGVNIAARLQSLAEPGRITVSDAVHGVVRGKIDAAFVDHGEQQVKNIVHPVRMFAVQQAHAVPAAAVSAPASTPSIAVLPFTNMSGDPAQEYFSDGISEDIITDLSKIAGLMVVARNSSFAYKNKSPDVRIVGRELGVTSVLEGSIRRAGNRVRITAQLIDATTGGHLWAERFDRDITDIFAVQDEVTHHIVVALRVTLRPAERVLLANTRTHSVEAHDNFLLGRELQQGANKTLEVFERMVAIFRRAIELDPGYAEPYAGLGMAYCLDFQNHWSGASDSLDVAAYFADQATTKGPHEPYAHYVAGVIAFWQRDLKRAITEANVALRLNPNYAQAVGIRGFAEIYNGAPLAAVPFIRRAITLDPVFAQQYWHFLGSAYLIAADYDSAINAFLERIRLAPKTDLSRAFLASALGNQGRSAEARSVWDELMALNPKYRLDEHLGRLPFRNLADLEGIRRGLANAGITSP
ncbi:MAG: adenylate/guanylate cyclase domain-containing protein, partial [Burkholderiaceae bacterium]